MLFFLKDTVDIVGSFYGKEWKTILFGYIVFFSQRKILIICILVKKRTQSEHKKNRSKHYKKI